MNNLKILFEEWRKLQPLKPEYQRKLDEKFMLEFNYNSNHLEGNTLTYGQTKLLLVFGKTSGDASLRDYEEMKAHNVGLGIIIREAKDKERSLSESFIRELNRVILVENFKKPSMDGKSLYEVKVGQYKTRPNHVYTKSEEIFHYATPEETPAMMGDLVDWYNKAEEEGELNPIELAALMHYRYIRIHHSESAAIRAIEESFVPLIKRLDANLSSFYDLFDEVRYSDDYNYSFEVEKLNASQFNIEYNKKCRISFNKDVFGGGTVNIEVGVEIDFNDDYYSIELYDNISREIIVSVDLNYEEIISEQQLNDIISVFGSWFANHVKNAFGI